ncbi:MAG: thiamine diphosphokinase [Chloroflexota bacterium]
MVPRSALIFANGAVRDGAFVRQAIANASEALVVAADGGARMAAEHFGMRPDVILGDLDSLTPSEVDRFRADGVTVNAFPAEKDETDLELALKWTASQGMTHIRVIGALGRRLDQTFGNVYLLALPELATIDTRLVAADQQIWLVAPGEHTLKGEVGDTISLIPLAGDIENITTDGLYYPLAGETLRFGPARGISNVLDATCATVRFTTGRLLIVHTIGRAE